ncbi:MAG: hypothetical protein KDM63_20095, partial [Verrucomicrobiae bacterium]|nr:hypothetical protein [Verrucomicrobiae bacterium]
RFDLGDEVDIDLSFITLSGTEKLSVLGLPKGLKFDPVTRHITGRILGLLGEVPLEIRVTNGKTIARSTWLSFSVSPYRFAGNYAALLELPDGSPEGLLNLSISSPETFTASLLLAGQAPRPLKGTFDDTPGLDQQALVLSFPAGSKGTPLATTVTVNLEALMVSDAVSGDRDGTVSALRGFRLANSGRTPNATQSATIALRNPASADGVTLPAGVGTLSGTIDPKGVVKLLGFTGDAQALSIASRLSQTNQAILWTQPYKNKAGYLGGVVSLGTLGLPDRSASSTAPLADGLKWSKAADPSERAYPDGFPIQDLSAEVSRWIAPPTATALAESLGLDFNEVGVAYDDPIGVADLPSILRLTERLALLRIAPDGALALTKGAVAKKTGTFGGSFALPNGSGAVSGVVLQDASFGTTVGTGLVRVPLPPGPTVPKGSFQTISVEFSQDLVAAPGTPTFPAPELATLNGLTTRFDLGDEVDIDLSFITLSGTEKLSVL